MEPPPHLPHTLVERGLEQVLFAGRWLLAPIYLGLTGSLVLLLVNFARKCLSLIENALTAGSDDTIIGVLSLIDLSLMANLLLIVIFAGYGNFISEMELEGHRDKPEWMAHVGFGDLKVKLMASIVAISAIHLLEDFMHIGEVTDRELRWAVAIHATFIVSALLLGVMDRITNGRTK